MGNFFAGPLFDDLGSFFEIAATLFPDQDGLLKIDISVAFLIFGSTFSGDLSKIKEKDQAPLSQSRSWHFLLLVLNAAFKIRQLFDQAPTFYFSGDFLKIFSINPLLLYQSHFFILR